MKYLILFCVVFLAMALPTKAGTLKVERTISGNLVSRELFFEGSIERGDAERLQDEIFKSGDAPIVAVHFASTGGSLSESLLLSAILNSTLVQVIPTRKSTAGYCEDDWVEDNAQCGCFSACAVIWMAAVNRSWFGTVGIHRPSMAKLDYSRLTSREAELAYEEMLEWLETYLTSQHVPTELISLLLSKSSAEMHELTSAEETMLPIYREFLAEHLDAKCFSALGRANYQSYHRELQAAYSGTSKADLAALLLLTFGKESEKNRKSPYSSCLQLELHKMAKERQTNPFVTIEYFCNTLPRNAAWVGEMCKPAVRK